LDLLQALAELCVGGNLVRGLEDDCAPIRRQGIGLMRLVSCLFFLSLFPPNEGKCSTYFSNNISELLFHFLLSAQKSLPEIITYASPLKKRATGLLGSLDVDQALNILNCASE
jgi:hypothetical protein